MLMLLMRKLILAFGVLFLLAASNAIAATIPANALVNFQVNAFASVGNGPYTTHVAAWMSTGLLLNAGDEFALEATGLAWVAPPFTAERSFGPDGDGALNCALNNGVETCLADIPNSRYALVGKIGTDLGDEFFVGSDFSGIANDSGLLFLAFNDSHYFDNSGFFTVSTAAVPEPSTALLLGFGLVGLTVRRKRLCLKPHESKRNKQYFELYMTK